MTGPVGPDGLATRGGIASPGSELGWPEKSQLAGLARLGLFCSGWLVWDIAEDGR